jgi:hypothetical protein
MIEPIWLPESGEDYKWPTQSDSTETYYETCFRLRLDEKNKKNVLKLTQNLTDACDENLLLFLNKLERMIYEDHLQKKRLDLSRIRLSPSWYQLVSRYDTIVGTHVSAGTSPPNSTIVQEVYWCTVRRHLNPTIMRAKNQPVESTDIAIALKFLPRRNEEEGTMSLSLDTSHRLPIYAYLPTKAEVYRFILQGDFLLSTSRESLLQDNDWNQYLFHQLPDLFLAIFAELSSWAWSSNDFTLTSEKREACPTLTEILTDSHFSPDASSLSISLQIPPQELLNLIPRASDSSSGLYREFVDSVSARLKGMPFLRADDSSLPILSPQQFVSITKLHFHPSIYITEEFLVEATGLHYLPSSLSFGEDLIHQLAIQTFDLNLILKCFDYFSHHFLRLKDASEKKYWSIFSGLLLCLYDFITPPQDQHSSSATHKHVTSVIPSQTIRKSSLPSLTSGLGKLPKSALTKLKNLPIWPTSRQTYVSVSEAQTLFFQPITNPSTANASGGSGSLSEVQVRCLKIFERDYLLLLETNSLFQAARDLHPMRRGHQLLSEMLSKNFKGEGIEILSPLVILRKVILPCYARYNSEDVATHLTREIASAFLGFVFTYPLTAHDAISGELAAHGIIIPTMVARQHRQKSISKLRWQSNGNILLRVMRTLDGEQSPSPEVHLGLEIPTAGIASLGKLPIHTALGQLDWLILDPLPAIILFQSSIHGRSPLDLPTTVENDFHCALNQHQATNWTNFLLNKVGLVNFFGIYSSKNANGKTKSEAPHLFTLLKHLTRNRTIVHTNKDEWLKIQKEKSVEQEENKDQVIESLESSYCPYYLPSAHNKYLFSVSSDVYDSLKVSYLSVFVSLFI